MTLCDNASANINDFGSDHNDSYNDTIDSSGPTIWAIGGAEPLGVGADLRASAANRVQCATIVTSVSSTSDNISALSIEMLKSQWRENATQSVTNIIKIGLLVNQSQVLWLGRKLNDYRQRYPQLTVIYQPVWFNKLGQSLVDQATLEAIKQHLLSEIDLLIVEADDVAVLLAHQPSSPIEVIASGRTLVDKFDLSVLLSVKGHAIQDCFFAAKRHGAMPEPEGFVMATPLQGISHILDANCTLSSLIACLLADGYSIADALILAKAIMSQAVFKPHPLGNERDNVFQLSPVNGFKDLPKLLSFKQFAELPKLTAALPEITPFAPCEANLGLYPMTESSEMLEKLLKLGVKTVQLRCQDLPHGEVEIEVKKAIALGRQYQARVVIYNDWQLALKHRAYGVHVELKNLTSSELNLIKNSGLRLGITTHNVHQALSALQLKPSYLTLADIGPTTNSDKPARGQYLAKLTLQLDLFNHRCPLVATGCTNDQLVVAIKASGLGAITPTSLIKESDNYQQQVTALLAQVGPGDQIR